MILHVSSRPLGMNHYRIGRGPKRLVRQCLMGGPTGRTTLVIAFQPSRQLGDVDGDPPRLVRSQRLGLQRFGLGFPRIDVQPAPARWRHGRHSRRASCRRAMVREAASRHAPIIAVRRDLEKGGLAAQRGQQDAPVGGEPGSPSFQCHSVLQCSQPLSFREGHCASHSRLRSLLSQLLIDIT
jgi:hypothetical protein